MSSSIHVSDPVWKLGIRLYHPDKPRDKWGHGVKLTKDERKAARKAVTDLSPIAFKMDFKTEYAGSSFMDWLVRKGIDTSFLEMRETSYIYL